MYLINILICVFICVSIGADHMPPLQIDVYSPKGLRVSIPDEKGIMQFSFEGRLNKDIDEQDDNTWNNQITQATNGNWVFYDKNAQMSLGDTLYYRIIVKYNDETPVEHKDIFILDEFSDRKQLDDEDLDCIPGETIINKGVVIRCSANLIFEDEFAGSALNVSKWRIERRFATMPDQEFAMYVDDVADVLNVKNGMLHIQPIPIRNHFKNGFPNGHDFGATCTGQKNTLDCVRPKRQPKIMPSILTAQISTKEHFSFKYGRIEIRAKLPSAPWVFPQIWLAPLRHKYGANDYQSGQMRVAFSRTNDNKIDLYGGVLLNSNEPLRSAKLGQRKTTKDVDYANNFHVYKLLWTEDLIALAVDNEEYYRINPQEIADALYNTNVNDLSLPNKNILTAGSKIAPFDQQFYITLGLGIGGHNDFADDLNVWMPEKPWQNNDSNGMKNFWKSIKNNFNNWATNADLDIDYVRVYSV